MIYQDWNNYDDVPNCLKEQEEETCFHEKLEELKNNVIKAYAEKEMYKGCSFELNNKFSVQVDRFADFKHHVYKSIVQEFVKDYQEFDPTLWKWIVKNASPYMDQVCCVDRTLLISHPDFVFNENYAPIKIQFKASEYNSSRPLLLPLRKSIEYLNKAGKSYIQPRELSLLNNIDVFVWYHWCPDKHDVVIHALKEPWQLFRLIQVGKKEDKQEEPIVKKPVRYGDGYQKVDMLYLNPTSKDFPKNNLFFEQNPFVH